jgi:hypothetical protein|tara:strand:+ start:5820 stop:7070 length:1251 start_codon:yes stop_codon:yes gene_type:complete
MRIAVTFSGALRTEDTWNDIKSYFISPKNSSEYIIDYFLYTTDKVDIHRTSFGRAKTLSKDYKDSENLTKKRVDNFIKCFNPVRVLIEPNLQFLDNLKTVSLESGLSNKEYNFISYSGSISSDWDSKSKNDFFQLSQVMKAEKVMKLVEDYEKDNNFEYDMIFKLRPDIFPNFLTWRIQYQDPSSPLFKVRLSKRPNIFLYKNLIKYFINDVKSNKFENRDNYEKYYMENSPVIFLNEYSPAISQYCGITAHRDWYTYGSSHATKLYYNNLSSTILEMDRGAFDIIYRCFNSNLDDYSHFLDLKNDILFKLLENTNIKLNSFEHTHLKTFFGWADHLWPLGAMKTDLRCVGGDLDFLLHRPGFPYPMGLKGGYGGGEHSFMTQNGTESDMICTEEALKTGDLELYDSRKAVGYFKI